VGQGQGVDHGQRGSIVTLLDWRPKMKTPRLWGDHVARVAVVGAGAFGGALAQCIDAGGCQVVVFAREKDLPGESHRMADITYSAMQNSNPEIESCDLIVLAIPAQSLREVSAWLRRSLEQSHQERRAVAKSTAEKAFVVSAAKGIERGTLQLPHQVLEESLSHFADVGSLSGPSFAKELLAGLPTAVVIATSNESLAQRCCELLHRSFFRVYKSQDIVGVEVAGALKNVIAMVAGAVDGLNLGNNARAAVVTRGLQEIAQVGVKLGAKPMTFLGLSGLGDLILTCTGDLSRNRQFGLRCARGESPQEIIASMGQVIEGVATAESAYQLARSLGLDTPILKVAHDVIYNQLPMPEAVKSLLTRAYKGEFDWMGS
jgi:glycerol-3-phosphate dehydrogenase (NAD(P)+)